MANEKIDESECAYFEVRVFAHNVFTRSSCLLCGGTIGKEGVAAVLEGFTKDREKKSDFGDICRECLDAGKAGAAERMRHRVVYLRAYAEWLEQFASEIVQVGSWASSDDLDRARRELDKEMGWTEEVCEDDSLPL